MDRKIVILLSIIFLSGILSAKGLARNYYTPNKFNIGTGDHKFTWKLYSDTNISNVKVSIPNNIKINKGPNWSGKKANITFKTDNIDRGIYIVSASIRPYDGNSVSYSAAVMVGITTDDELNSIKNRVASTEVDIDDLKDKISNLEDGIDSLGSDIKALENKSSERKEDIKSLENRLNTLNTEKENLKDRLNNYEEEMEKLKSTTSTGSVSKKYFHNPSIHKYIQ